MADRPKKFPRAMSQHERDRRSTPTSGVSIVMPEPEMDDETTSPPQPLPVAPADPNADVRALITEHQAILSDHAQRLGVLHPGRKDHSELTELKHRVEYNHAAVNKRMDGISQLATTLDERSKWIVGAAEKQWAKLDEVNMKVSSMTTSLHAKLDDIVKQGSTIETKQASQDQKFDAHAEKFDQHDKDDRAGFAKINGFIDQANDRIGALETHNLTMAAAQDATSRIKRQMSRSDKKWKRGLWTWSIRALIGAVIAFISAASVYYFHTPVPQPQQLPGSDPPAQHAPASSQEPSSSAPAVPAGP